MDGWTRQLTSIKSLWIGISRLQKVTLVGVAFIVLASTGWLIYTSQNPPQALLLGGKSFSADELKRTLDAFKLAGLVQHRLEGTRISVPASEVDRYTAAAVAQKALPAQFAAEFDRMQSRVNLFTSSEQRRELMEEARKTRLAQILRAIPEIEDAVVEWDRAKSTSLFRAQSQLAAHVSVRPRAGGEMTPELVQSLKQFIAGALAGATPEDVTVVDMNTSRVYGRQTAAEAALERMKSLARQYSEASTRQMTQALQHIPHVLVSVNVECLPLDVDADLEVIDAVDVVKFQHSQNSGIRSARTNSARVQEDNRVALSPITLSNRSAAKRMVSNRMVSHRTETKGHSTHSFRMTESEWNPSDGELPFQKSVQVVVSIPQQYYAELALRRGVAPGNDLVADREFRAAMAEVKLETQDEVRETLTRLLPSDTSPDSISVTTYNRPNEPNDRSDPNEIMRTGKSAKRTSKVSQWTLEQIVPVSSVAICALIVVWSLSRRTKRERPTTSSNSPLGTLENHPTGTQTVAPTEEIVSRNSRISAAKVDPERDSLNPYSAILSELAERERDTVMGGVPQSGVFDFLCQLTPVDASDFLRNEHPQTIALVATGLPTGRAAEILHALPEALRWDVTQRISRMEPPQDSVSREIAQNLSQRLIERNAKILLQSTNAGVRRDPRVRIPIRNSAIPTANFRTSDPAPGMTGSSPPAPVEAPLPEFVQEAAAATQPGFATQTGFATQPGFAKHAAATTQPAQMSQESVLGTDPGPVTFEDLCLLDRMAFSRVLRNVDARSFAVALFDRPEPFKKRFISLIPKSMATAIAQQTRILGPLRLSDISATQRMIAVAIWNLAQQGAIQLPPHLVRR